MKRKFEVDFIGKRRNFYYPSGLKLVDTVDIALSQYFSDGTSKSCYGLVVVVHDTEGDYVDFEKSLFFPHFGQIRIKNLTKDIR